MNDELFEQKINELVESNKQQADYAKLSFIMSLISAISCIIILVAILVSLAFVVPRMNNMIAEAETAVKNIETVSAELAEANLADIVNDIGGLVGNVESLVEDTSEDLGSAIKKLNEIDIDELNAAIKNLSDVVEPLASLFNRPSIF